MQFKWGLSSERSTVLYDRVLVLHNDIVYPYNHSDRFRVNKVCLVKLNFVEVLWIASHRLKGLQVVYPEFGSAVELKNGRCVLNTAEVAEFGRRVIL
ncbi:hypothetical protein HYQ45_006854 [Verticillium longisporum]|uniref:Uncharacterized protein n=1 Tax=Verticillium longisporum TaxID=100787 RepID=A0A8I2ZQ33_VERLO|nr:hypothetical protein HYQ45_006854 [Verticillium longisporum]